MPKTLIYKIQQYKSGTQAYNQWEEFIMFNKDKGLVGRMVCRRMKGSWRTDYNKDMLGIDFLLSHKSECGYGKSFIKFAKNYSKQIGCNGYILLKADPSFTPNKTPHLFYRKNGFGTSDMLTDKKMDKMIKNGINSTYHDFPSLLMYYPPVVHTKKSFSDKFYKFINKLSKLFV